MLYRVDDMYLESESQIENQYLESKQTSEKSLLDQHLEVAASNSHIWLIPLTVLTVGLTFDGAILEYFDLIWGLLGQLFESINRKCLHGTIFLKCL